MGAVFVQQLIKGAEAMEASCFITVDTLTEFAPGVAKATGGWITFFYIVNNLVYVKLRNSQVWLLFTRSNLLCKQDQPYNPE